MAASGVKDILLTSPIVDRNKIARMVALARTSDQRIMLSCGHGREADLLSQAAEAADVRVDVLIDLDVGDKRTGILPGESAVQLARHIGRSKHLNVRGVQAYAGFASHTVGFENRSTTSREALAKAVETKLLLRKAGFDARILSGGSTGTYNIDSEIEGMSELQVGSYIFMDVNYRAIGGRDDNSVYTDFLPSLMVLATVVSNTHSGRVSIDAGTKALDTTTTSSPQVRNMSNLVYTRAGDEFGALTSDSKVNLPDIGQRLELIVPHCDPSVNLYDRIYACRGEKVEEIWPILARRESHVTRPQSPT
jgi:D-serine deaminase-like pyridoxal phosphate-dependent protein